MAVTLPEGDLQSRLDGYLEGLRNRHGLEESAIEGNVVRIVVDPESVPAVLTTARETLAVLHLSFITVVDRVGSFELTYDLLDLRGGRVRVKATVEGEEPVVPKIGRVSCRERVEISGVAVSFKKRSSRRPSPRR